MEEQKVFITDLNVPDRVGPSKQKTDVSSDEDFNDSDEDVQESSQHF
jgi:hypothetical protein